MYPYDTPQLKSTINSAMLPHSHTLSEAFYHRLHQLWSVRSELQSSAKRDQAGKQTLVDAIRMIRNSTVSIPFLLKTKS